MKPYHINSVEIFSYSDEALRELYWDSGKHIKMEVLEVSLEEYSFKRIFQLF